MSSSSQTSPLTCLRCGAPYEDGQTVCFKCGAPIGEVKTPTQPVPILHLPKREAPAEPETPPTPVAVSTIESPPKAEVSTPRSRPRWPVYALVGLLVLALVGGGGYLLRAVLAGPPVASDVTYKDPQGRFHFTRPNLWVLTASSDGVVVTDSGGTSRLQITLSAPGLGEGASAHADTLAQAQGLTQAAAQTYAGETWEQRTGVVTGSDGVVRQEVLLVTLHGSQLYTIEYASPLSTFDSTNNLVFQPLLTSFTFDK